MIVKDGSLGGRYPVLGAILIDPQRNSYHVHFGASPSLDIALQRCLTEAFQGVSLDSNSRLKRMAWDDAAFGFLFESNRKPMLRERVAWRDFVGNGTGEVPTSLKTASDADVRACLKTIEDVLLETRFPSWSLIPRICQVVITPEADFAQLYNAKLLLALLHHRLGDAREAAEAFRRYLFDPASGGNADGGLPTKFEYGAEALAFHTLKASGRDDAVVRQTLGELFGEERAGEAVAEFLRHEQVFRRFSLPQCSSCEGCEAVSDCQYPAWRALAERVRDKLLSRPIDQTALRSVLQIHP